jgi:hypothetical protein
VAKTIVGKIMDAFVSEKDDGIYLKIRCEKGDLVCFSSIQEDWLKIPEGKNSHEELQKVVDLLTGYRYINGEKESIPGFIHKNVTIELE